MHKTIRTTLTLLKDCAAGCGAGALSWASFFAPFTVGIPTSLLEFLFVAGLALIIAIVVFAATLPLVWIAILATAAIFRPPLVAWLVIDIVVAMLLSVISNVNLGTWNGYSPWPMIVAALAGILAGFISHRTSARKAQDP
ncbi:hypothetical protein [Qipengyuania citrea]|uniref:hypothetical protein n=1 Tax=Qipengyuania citrea TaxID=225971 RepID=UPI00329A1054